ncbi:LOW QUALITY PROTEIN: methyltransferase-like 26 B [Osmerus eperlanus]|uniref:LOW QUALITY PROTEIN: methyltransferase-like 26 B n=1 Tax=Osmerus eperlanus TaxID=29151 RepID=UPI002E1115A2
MLLSTLAGRNQDCLLSVTWVGLEEQSHRDLLALELGSGTGQHVVHFAMEMSFVTWQPSALKEESLESIRAYTVATKVKTVLQPVHLDAHEPWEKWAGLPQNSCDVIVAINLLQCSPFKTAQGVFKEAGQILQQNGFFIMYGVCYRAKNYEKCLCCSPYGNPEWGLPDKRAERQLAYRNALRLERMESSLESV